MMIDPIYSFRSRSLSDGTGDAARPIYSATTSDGTQTGNFINADWAIVYDFTVEEDTRFASCEVTADAPTCAQATTYAKVASFAAVIIIKLFQIHFLIKNHFRTMIPGSLHTMKLMTS